MPSRLSAGSSVTHLCHCCQFVFTDRNACSVILFCIQYAAVAARTVQYNRLVLQQNSASSTEWADVSRSSDPLHSCPGLLARAGRAALASPQTTSHLRTVNEETFNRHVSEM
jgi:hypothetical protein